MLIPLNTLNFNTLAYQDYKECIKATKNIAYRSLSPLYLNFYSQ